MSTDAPRRIVRLASELWLPITKTDETAALLESAAHNCPVAQSLNPYIDRPVTFHWAGE
jgi:putative redox protein